MWFSQKVREHFRISGNGFGRGGTFCKYATHCFFSIVLHLIPHARGRDTIYLNVTQSSFTVTSPGTDRSQGMTGRED